MKIKKKLCLFLLILIIFITFNQNSYAITLPELGITSNNYSSGNKITLSEETNVEIEKTLQLYAIVKYGKDVYDPSNPDSMGWYVQESNLTGTVWSSNNTEIATIDNTGKVTGISEGKATITANYNGKESTYEITVNPKSNSNFTGISFLDKSSIPQPALILNEQHGFLIYLYNIPDTEKENINITIDNTNIASLTSIDLCNSENNSEKEMIIANVNFLSLGQTKITATLSYNGNTYSESYDFKVIESMYSLSLSSKDYDKLPTIIEIGNKIQLTANLKLYGSSLLPEDVTSNGVIWTSSNETVATVDNKGLVSSIGEGSLTITAKYLVGDKTITATYDLKITDSAKSYTNLNANNDATISKTALPRAGVHKIIYVLLVSSIIIAILMYIWYTKYKKSLK